MAALNATCVWEVENAGSDANGCLFDPGVSSPGTDYSYGSGQVSYSYTDIVIGATTTQGTSVARPFVTADNGNGLNVASGTGFTVQTVEMTAEAAGTATFNNSLGTTLSTGGHGVLGGPAASPGHVLGLGVAQNAYWVEYSATPYSESANPTTNAGAGGGSSGNLFNAIKGYNATRGDNPTGTSRPVIQAASGCTILLPLSSGGWILEYLIFDANSIANSCLTNASGYTNIYQTTFKNFKQYGLSITSAAQAVVNQCEVTGGVSGATAGINCSATVLTVTGSYIHANVCPGIVMSNSGLTVTRNIIYSNTGASSDGIQAIYASTITNNAIYGNGRDGIRNTNYFNIALCWQNNLFVSNGGYGINFTATPSIATNDPSFDGNFYYNNTSGARHNCGSGVLDVIGTGDPCNNASGGDFSLIAGTTARATAFPQTWPGLASMKASAPDMGAWQGADNVAHLFRPSMMAGV